MFCFSTGLLPAKQNTAQLLKRDKNMKATLLYLLILFSCTAVGQNRDHARHNALPPGPPRLSGTILHDGARHIEGKIISEIRSDTGIHRREFVILHNRFTVYFPDSPQDSVFIYYVNPEKKSLLDSFSPGDIGSVMRREYELF